MRIVLASLLGVGLVGLAGCASEPSPSPPPAPQVIARAKPAFPPPVLAPVCGKPAETAALAVAALRMQLSVTELTCDGREQFNAFTARFHNEVGAQNKTVGAFFSRAYGKRGVSQQDEYETGQINQTSEAGQYYGADFCKTAMPMFDQVLALKDGTDLVNYALAQNFDQVLKVNECAPPAAPAPKAPAKAPAAASAKTPAKS